LPAGESIGLAIEEHGVEHRRVEHCQKERKKRGRFSPPSKLKEVFRRKTIYST
jgi:hypothetical protein